MGDTTQFIKKKASTASWKTSMFGIGSILAGIGTLIKCYQDQDWNQEHIIAAFGLISTGFMGIFARDNNKSSEDAGVKPAHMELPESRSVPIVEPPKPT